MNRALAQAFPHVYCELDFTTVGVTVATILSAQSTDKRVNLTTPALFKRYRTALDYAQADRAELEELIRPTGFYRNKANSLIGLGRELVERFDGKCPPRWRNWVTLPGVGRKTANVILGNAFDIPGITVDTHFGRLVRRWRWTAEEDPVKVEHAVGELIERSEWTLLSHRVIFHGRRVCHARHPACGVCVLAKDCPSFGAGPTDPVHRGRPRQGTRDRAPAGAGRAVVTFDEHVDPLDRCGAVRRGGAGGRAVHPVGGRRRHAHRDGRAGVEPRPPRSTPPRRWPVRGRAPISNRAHPRAPIRVRRRCAASRSSARATVRPSMSPGRRAVAPSC